MKTNKGVRAAAAGIGILGLSAALVALPARAEPQSAVRRRKNMSCSVAGRAVTGKKGSTGGGP